MSLEEIVILLEALLVFPKIFNHIDELEADWLQSQGYFDEQTYTVTLKGLGLLKDVRKTA